MLSHETRCRSSQDEKLKEKDKQQREGGSSSHQSLLQAFSGPVVDVGRDLGRDLEQLFPSEKRATKPLRISADVAVSRANAPTSTSEMEKAYRSTRVVVCVIHNAPLMMVVIVPIRSSIFPILVNLSNYEGRKGLGGKRICVYENDRHNDGGIVKEGKLV